MASLRRLALPTPPIYLPRMMSSSDLSMAVLLGEGGDKTGLGWTWYVCDGCGSVLRPAAGQTVYGR